MKRNEAKKKKNLKKTYLFSVALKPFNHIYFIYIEKRSNKSSDICIFEIKSNQIN